MRPSFRLPVLPCLAVFALGLPVWLDGQPQGASVAATAGQPLPGGQGAARGRGRGPAPAAAGPTAASLPYLAEPTLGGLTFDQPLDIVTAPGDPSRLFILEKTGRIIVIPDVKKPTRVTFLDLTAKVGSTSVERGLLALAFHPDWKRNRQFYIWYTATPGSESHDTLARLTVSATDANQADPASEVPLITQVDQAPNHNGGQLAFGPDGYLYLSLGDEGGANDQYQNSQRIDKNFFSGLLRLDVDHKPGSLPPNPHPSVHAGTYAVPADNPWVGAKTFNNLPVDPAKVHTEFWAVGLRNPWRWSFDPVTNLLWLADVGQDRIEEIDLIKRGGNYGWNYREGNEPFLVPARGGRGPGAPGADSSTPRVLPLGVTFEEPIYTYFHPGLGGTPADTGNSITGGFVYRGQALPALNNRYLFADYQSGLICALGPVQADNAGKLIGKVSVQLIARRPGIVSFGQDPVTGDVLLANISTGHIERLVVNPNPTPPAVPTIP